MTGYLVKRPVAVLTVTAAVLVLGLVAVFHLPTSLMPDIDIPEITVQISYPGHNARELEDNVVRHLRQTLLQVNHLEHIESETRDEFALIRLRFSYGTPVHYAFIETNEKIDGAMERLPGDLSRPKVIKASAADIPVLNLVVVPPASAPRDFLQWSEFARNVLKKRLEQLPEVAVADMSGAALPQISIVPDQEILTRTGIRPDQITNALRTNNLDGGHFMIRNGIYQYRFKLDRTLHSVDDIRQTPFMHKGKLYKIGDVARVLIEPAPRMGMFTYRGRPAIVFGIIKQSDAKISELKKKLFRLIDTFREDYPELQFYQVNDQARLLEISLSNLSFSLLLGILLAFGILYFFIRNLKVSVIIAISIPLSVIISMLLLWLWGLSVNVISLSGLILGVGLMIDNAIIVIDNIVQKSGQMPLFDAVTRGAKEVAGPLISSALTTVSVFVPLIFLSGMAGALFYDQAVSITAGLMTSVAVSLFFIPVIFFVLLKNKRLQLSSYRLAESGYDKAYRYFSSNPKIVWAVVGTGFILLGLFWTLPREKFPELTRADTMLTVQWDEALDVETQKRLIDSLLRKHPDVAEYMAYIGKQDFLLQRDMIQDPAESQVYVRFSSSAKRRRFEDWLSYQPVTGMHFSFRPPGNVFYYIFGNPESGKAFKLYSRSENRLPPPGSLLRWTSRFPGLEVPLQEVRSIRIKPDKLLFYDIPYERLKMSLQSLLESYTVDQMKNEKEYVPIRLRTTGGDFYEKFRKTYVYSRNGKQVPLSVLAEIRTRSDWKKITADRKGEYLAYTPPSEMTEESIKKTIRESPFIMVPAHSGQRKLFKELIWVTGVALVLLYLIMAAQFESLWQPLIILLEIPVNTGFALLVLSLSGNSVNIMSLIGLIVMSGIVVNDSILKIHTVNLLLRGGLPLEQAVHEAGKIRLKPILMTTFTTVFALLPVLFMQGMGAELQKPLAWVVTGGLLAGTFVSLFFIPSAYKFFYRMFEKHSV